MYCLIKSFLTLKKSSNNKVVNGYLLYKINYWLTNLSHDITRKDYWLGAIKFKKKFIYNGLGIISDCSNVFSFIAGGFTGNLVVFTVDKSLSKEPENVNDRFSITRQRTKSVFQ